MHRKNLRLIQAHDEEERVGRIIGPESDAIIQKRQARQLKRRPAMFNSTIFVNSGRVVSLSSLQVLPDNPNRKYILIQNKSGGVIYISFGTKADDFNGIEIVPGGVYEPYKTPRTSLNILATVANSTVGIIEGYGGK